YDLTHMYAQKTQEYHDGIGCFYQHMNALPSVPLWAKRFYALIKRFNPNQLTYYPGSPAIIQAMLRPQDRGVSCELHPEDFKLLRRWAMSMDNKLHVHHMNGYMALKALLPPAERRGLVLIDPPFEQPNEFTAIIQGLQVALNRFRHGVYAVWYPIKEKLPIMQFYNALYAENSIQKIWVAEFVFYPSRQEGLQGCGMAVINPPWQLYDTIQNWLPELVQATRCEGNATYKIEWLKGGT
ncbi:MAG: 23S rRNA (adenine(2030)-N(6))-methyltransferase RlmJ, partial [Burkholderiales bacterium]